jgi:NADPH-dependent 2,4-dienoyl-CoA reductase/sulfur reductase-like enzyme
VISFLEKAFIDGNIRSISESRLEEQLEDYLIYIRSIYGDESYPRTPFEYLDGWADSSRGWLRKYYPRTGDEAEFDITPSAEKVIENLKNNRFGRNLRLEQELINYNTLLEMLKTPN